MMLSGYQIQGIIHDPLWHLSLPLALKLEVLHKSTLKTVTLCRGNKIEMIKKKE